jgi:hypothetical protein
LLLHTLPFTRGHWSTDFLSSSATDMIARLIKSEDDLALLERLGLGYPIIEEILLRHGLHYSNEPAADIAEESASFSNGWNRDEWLVHNDPGFDEHFPCPLFLR